MFGTVCRLRPIIRRRQRLGPVVILQIGGNDLCSKDADSVVNSLIDILFEIRQKPGVHQIIFLELTHRVSTRRFHLRMGTASYNAAVNRVNTAMAAILAEFNSVGIYFWSHRERLMGINQLCTDGVHFSQLGMRNYWRSVRGAAICAIRRLRRGS